jgi:hypothetical protein
MADCDIRYPGQDPVPIDLAEHLVDVGTRSPQTGFRKAFRDNLFGHSRSCLFAMAAAAKASDQTVSEWIRGAIHATLQ